MSDGPCSRSYDDLHLISFTLKSYKQNIKRNQNTIGIHHLRVRVISNQPRSLVWQFWESYDDLHLISLAQKSK